MGRNLQKCDTSMIVVNTVVVMTWEVVMWPRDVEISLPALQGR